MVFFYRFLSPPSPLPHQSLISLRGANAGVVQMRKKPPLGPETDLSRGGRKLESLPPVQSNPLNGSPDNGSIRLLVLASPGPILVLTS